MALRFMDSFDHYASGDVTEKWTALNNSPTVTSGVGRRSTSGLRINAASEYVSKTLDAQATWIVGVAHTCSSFAGSAAVPIIGLYDVSTLQVDLRVNTDGTLQITRGGTVLGTSAFALSLGVTHYIELKVTIHDTTGAAQVKVDGDSKLSLSNVDTKATANASATTVRVGTLHASVNLGTQDLDDLYICDGQGSTNNDCLGDCRVDCLLPNSNGDDRDWALSTGSDDYAVLDDTAPNDDTDYAWDDTVGQRLLVGAQNLTALTSPSIKGVMISASAKKSDAGARGIGVNVKSGTTESDGSDQALSTSYTYYTRVLDTDPATSAAFTEGGVNSLQVGVEVTS
jgi:hypothetical protein